VLLTKVVLSAMNNETNEVLFRPPRKVTIVESIVDQIVEQIHQGKLNPGDRLPSERHLIEMLGVSRSSVREALQGLMVMGLVESRPGQGSFVSSRRGRLPPNLDSMALSEHLQREMRLQLIEARRTIEPPIARLAAERATPEGVGILRQRFADYSRDPFGHLGDPQLPSAHSALHLDLAEMTGNPFFVAVVDNLLRAVPQTLRSHEERALDDSEMQQIIADEIAMHDTLIQAIERKDGEAADQIMDYHLDYERRLVMRLFPGETAS